MTTKCVGRIGVGAREKAVECLERDIDEHRALVQCPQPLCGHYSLRKIIRTRSLGRRWSLTRLSWREQRRSCCNSSEPGNNVALHVNQLGASDKELNAAERPLDPYNPGEALILICLHCSTAIPFFNDERFSEKWCFQCWCPHCPLVFMLRRVSVSFT